MADISPHIAAVIFLVWPALTGFCVWKYLRALKEKKRLDAWIWFFAWAMCITAIEWWVLSLMIVFKINF